MLFDDPQFDAIYEDSYQFVLDGISFSIRCRIDSFGVTYFPDAINQVGIICKCIFLARVLYG